MKSLFRAALVAASLAFVATAQAQAPAAPPKPAAPAPAKPANKQNVSIMLAMDVAQSMQVIKNDLDLPAFGRAFALALAGQPTALTPAQAAKIKEQFSAEVQARLQARKAPTDPVTPTKMPHDKVSTMIAMDVAAAFEQIKGEIDPVAFSRALALSLAGKPTGLTVDEARAVGAAFGQAMQAKFAAMQAQQGKDNLAKGNAFLAANKAKPGIRTTDSGLQYQVLRPGAGARPTAADTVRVHYRGTTLDGKEFDSSYAHGGQPVEFALGQVIPGWREGLALMTVGSKYRFWIPAKLAYGPNGMPPAIGPNATLAFEVELLGVSK
jgi:FKBP-type peptidyl-prolyl cis-trans isomerase